MSNYFLANINIQGKGGVVASPSTSQPDYYYHWQRDGAISIREMMNIRTIQASGHHCFFILTALTNCLVVWFPTGGGHAVEGVRELGASGTIPT